MNVGSDNVVSYDRFSTLGIILWWRYFCYDIGIPLAYTELRNNLIWYALFEISISIELNNVYTTESLVI